MKVTSLLLVVITASACGSSQGTTPAGPRGDSRAGDRADISPVRADLQGYTDGQGHLVALVEPDPEKEVPGELVLFYGDGKTMHAVPVAQYSSDGLKFEIGFNDPRIPAVPAGSITRELGKVTLSCYGTEVELTKLPAAESQAMVGAASFVKNRTTHAPLALVRDGDRLVYVDYGLHSPEGKSYRVFAGKQGHMREIKVDDAKYDEGENQWSFRTKDGVLTAMRDPQQSSYTITLAWQGKKESWTSLPRAENWKLIYEDLGIYPAGRSPTPCDPMLP